MKTKTQISFAVTAKKLISAFVFAIPIVQSLYFLNPKFQASSHLLWQYSPVCVIPGRKSRRTVFSQRGSYEPGHEDIPLITYLVLVCLFGLRLYIPVNNFSVMSHVRTFSWVEPVLGNTDELSCSRIQHRVPGEIRNPQPCNQESGTLPTELMLLPIFGTTISKMMCPPFYNAVPLYLAPYLHKRK